MKKQETRSTHHNHRRSGTRRRNVPSHKKRRRGSHFLRNLLLCTSVLLIGIFCIFFRLWNYLADYQKTLPSMLGDEILHAYQSGDTSVIRKYCDTLPETLGDDMVFHQYLNDVIGKEDLYYYESSAQNNHGGKSSITYTFSVRDQAFATLVVSKTPAESKYGFPVYEISSLEQYPLQDYTFQQAPGTQILIDGSPIVPAYMTEQTPAGTVFEQIEAGPFSSITYVLPDYLAVSNITAADSSGSTCELTWNEDHTICTSSYALDTDILQQISNFAADAAKEYAVFATIKYASSDSLLKYLYPGTDFYKAIKTYDNDWGITKTSDSFDSVKVTDAIQYSPTEYSCVVSFDYLVKQGNTQKTYPLCFTCYITTKNGSPQIVNLETKQ